MDATALQDKIAGLLAFLEAAPEIKEITGALETLEQEGGPERLITLFTMA